MGIENIIVTQIGIAIVESENRFLVGVRSEKTTLAGYHEFPGGKQQDGENSSQTAIRECKEETGLEVVAVRLLHQTSFPYEHGEVQLDFWLCELCSSSEGRVLHAPWQWIPRKYLPSLKFPPANAEIIEQLTTGIDSSDGQTGRGEFD